jgi:hypothetical protein
LVQWYVAGILPRICSPLRLYEITNYEETLQKTRVDSYDDGPLTSSTIERLEEKIEHLKKPIKNLSIRWNEVWCITCLVEGHRKDSCPVNEHTQKTDNTKQKIKNIAAYVNA